MSQIETGTSHAPQTDRQPDFAYYIDTPLPTPETPRPADLSVFAGEHIPTDDPMFQTGHFVPWENRVKMSLSERENRALIARESGEIPAITTAEPSVALVTTENDQTNGSENRELVDPVEERTNQLISEWDAMVQSELAKNRDFKAVYDRAGIDVEDARTSGDTRKIDGIFGRYRAREISNIAAGYPHRKMWQAVAGGIAEGLEERPDTASQTLGKIINRFTRQDHAGTVQHDLPTLLAGIAHDAFQEATDELLTRQLHEDKGFDKAIKEALTQAKKGIKGKLDDNVVYGVSIAHQMYKQGVNVDRVRDMFHEIAVNEIRLAEELASVDRNRLDAVKNALKIGVGVAAALAGLLLEENARRKAAGEPPLIGPGAKLRLGERRNPLQLPAPKQEEK